MKIGEFVKSYRKEHGLSMQAFGDLCGLSRAYISILEKGINPTTGRPFAPTVDTLKKISDITDVPFDVLLNMLDADQSILVNAAPAPSTKKVPKELRKLLEDEEIALNGRMMTDEDKEKMLKIIEAAFWEAKEMNRRKG